MCMPCAMGVRVGMIDDEQPGDTGDGVLSEYALLQGTKSVWCCTCALGSSPPLPSPPVCPCLPPIGVSVQSLFTVFKLYGADIYGHRVLQANLNVVASGGEWATAAVFGCLGEYCAERHVSCLCLLYVTLPVAATTITSSPPPPGGGGGGGRGYWIAAPVHQG